MTKHIFLLCGLISRIAVFIGGGCLVNGILHLLGQLFNHTVLFNSPHPGSWKRTGENQALKPLWLLVADIVQKQHSAPGLAQKMYLVKAKVFSKGNQLINPGLRIPQIRTVLNIGFSAANLVIHHQFTPVLLCQTVKHLKIIVC